MRDEIRKQAKIIASRFGKTKEQKEDIEGRCLEAAWRAEERLDPNLYPKAFIEQSMINAAINYTKALRSKKNSHAITELDHSSVEFEAQLVDTIVAEEVIESLLKELKSPHKEIVKLLSEGFTIDEIGEALDMRPNTISVIIFRHKDTWGKILSEKTSNNTSDFAKNSKD